MIGLARLIRDHGDAVEADLAFRGIDVRDLWRHGSGMTLRRLAVLVFNLPADSATWRSYAVEQEKALKPKAEQIRDRQAYYDRQREKEAAS